MLSQPVCKVIKRDFSMGERILEAIETLQNLLQIQANDTPTIARVVITIENPNKPKTKFAIVLENGIEITETMTMALCVMEASAGVCQFLNRRPAEPALSKTDL